MEKVTFVVNNKKYYLEQEGREFVLSEVLFGGVLYEVKKRTSDVDEMHEHIGMVTELHPSDDASWNKVEKILKGLA